MATWIGSIERVVTAGPGGTYRVVVPAVDPTVALGPMEAAQVPGAALAAGDRVVVQDLAGAASGFVIVGRLGG